MTRTAIRKDVQLCKDAGVSRMNARIRCYNWRPAGEDPTLYAKVLDEVLEEVYGPAPDPYVPWWGPPPAPDKCKKCGGEPKFVRMALVCTSCNTFMGGC